MLKQRSAIALLVLVVGSLLTLLAWLLIIEVEVRKAEVQFEYKAAPLLVAVEQAVAADIDVVRSITSFYRGSSSVDRAEFAAFTADALSHYPSIAALEWVPRVPAAELEQYTAAAVSDGLKDYQVRELSEHGLVPAGERDEYYPVYFVEPLEANRKVLGVDLYSNPARRMAMDQARDSGEPVASGRIQLIQDEAPQSGFLVFAPFYRVGVPLDTVTQRRQALVGFALGVYRVDDLIQASLSQLKSSDKSIQLDLLDVSAQPGERILYSSSEHFSATEAEQTAVFELAHSFMVGGREWRIVLYSDSTGLGVYNQPLPWVVMMFGLFLTGSLYLYLRRLSVKSEDDERRVLEQEGRLRHSEAFNSAVLATVVDGIITIDPKGIVQSCNPATEKMFGFSSAELIGQNIKMLMPEKYAQAHDGYLQHHMTTGEAHVIGVGREVEGQRKNGRVFPLDLAVSRMEVNGQVFFTGVVRDITERKKIEKMKSEFISTVSHELRTPLTSIRGAMGLVAGGAAGELPAQAKKLVDIAANNSERLVRLINDILDIEKIESGKMQFDLAQQPIVSLIEQAIEENKAYAEQFGSRYVFTTELTDLQLKIDSDRIRQVLDNLLSNAAKYGANADVVEVSLVQKNGCAELRVTDHGKGIAEEFQAQVFGKFAQADSSDTRQKGGTGLGLNIAKAIVEHHRGKIWFETEQDVGTSFIVQLPLMVEAPLPVKINPGSRVLICEDNLDIGQLLKLMLEKEQVIADLVTTAEDALLMLNQHDYQLMTLDLKLAGEKDGFSLLNDLRNSEKLKELPVVVVSGREQSDSFSALQISDWICKPIDEKHLLRAVKSAINGLPSRESARILHVEDDEDIAVVLGAMLEAYAEVDVAFDLATARRKLAQHNYDLIILDIGLPDGSGLDLLPELSGAQTNTPVVIFSAQEVSEESAQRVAGVMVKSRAGNKTMVEMVKELLNSTPDQRRTEQREEIDA